MGRNYATQFHSVPSNSKILFFTSAEVCDFRFGWVCSVSNFSTQNNASKFKYPWRESQEDATVVKFW
jgi:hypothetical protein